MDKRYQVFVSSTYTDLIDERQIVFQTLMEMDCIPAGMELFPAADEDQFEFIKKVIDDCDYYLLIIGGRYGTLAVDQISYTEKEFDYAISQGKKVVVLVHKDPAAIPSGKSETDPDIREKLESFKNKAMTGRLVDFWEESKDLRGMVAVSLNKTIKMFPTVGWVRGSAVMTSEIAAELNELRSANVSMRERLNQSQSVSELEVADIADFNDEFRVLLSERTRWDGSPPNESEINVTWKQIFHFLAPYLYDFPKKQRLHESFVSKLKREFPTLSYDQYTSYVYANDFDVILAQMQAYGLVATEYVTTVEGNTSLHVKLLKKGNAEYTQSLVVRK